MDKGQALEIARRYIDYLKERYEIQSAILFGSYARGTNHDDSDIDIAIIFDHVNDIIDMQIELMKLRRKIDLRIEPHPFESGEFNRNNPVAHEILKYGIKINIKAA